MAKKAALLWNEHRKEWELWHQSEVRAHGTDREKVAAWASEHNYDFEHKEGDK